MSRLQHYLAAKSCPTHNLLKVRFWKYFTEMTTILRSCVVRKFGSLPWRPRSQHDLASKSCPAHNFVIWSRILQLFHRNDHHIETMCRVQHLGCYLEDQGHSMTLQQNRVWPKTLFEVRYYNCFWLTTSLCPIPIRGALPGSDRLLSYPCCALGKVESYLRTTWLRCDLFH